MKILYKIVVIASILTLYSNARDMHYRKPGNFVSLEQSLEKVEANKTSTLKLKFTTSIKNENMVVNLKLGEGVNSDNFYNNKLSYSISLSSKESENEYKIKDINLYAKQDGIYYVYINISILNLNKARAFVVPFYVGDYDKTIEKPKFQKSESGENITILKAEEKVIYTK